MKHEETTLSDRAAQLRLAFDQTFAEAPASVSAPSEAFLAITAGGDNYALRLGEITGLFVDKKVVPLPSQAPDLLGIASFRGALVPVYDLRSLLGYADGQVPRWLVLVAPEAPIGLAFDHLDGYLDVPRAAIASGEGTEHRRQYLAETVRAAGIVRPVVRVAAIVETIRQRAQSTLSHKEI